MTNQFKFEPSNVICNSNSNDYIDLINPDNVSLLKSFINTHFMINSIDVILDEMIETGCADPDQGYCIGAKCSNTAYLVNKMITGMLDYSMELLKNEELAIMYVNAQIELMSASSISIILKSAIIYAASQDHYEEFELVKN